MKEELRADYFLPRPDFMTPTENETEKYREWLREENLHPEEYIQSAKPVRGYLDGLEPQICWGGWCANDKWGDFRRFKRDEMYRELEKKNGIPVIPDFTAKCDYIQSGADYYKAAEHFPMVSFSYDSDTNGYGVMRYSMVCRMASAAAAYYGKTARLALTTHATKKAPIALACNCYANGFSNEITDRMESNEKQRADIYIVFCEQVISHMASLGSDKQNKYFAALSEIYNSFVEEGLIVSFIKASETTHFDEKTKNSCAVIIPVKDNMSWWDMCGLDKYGKSGGHVYSYSVGIHTYERWGFGMPKKEFYKYYGEMTECDVIRESNITRTFITEQKNVAAFPRKSRNGYIIGLSNTGTDDIGNFRIKVLTDRRPSNISSYSSMSANLTYYDLKYSYSDGYADIEIEYLPKNFGTLLFITTEEN